MNVMDDERTLAIAIITRCAAYVRGFYPAPPERLECQTSWHMLQYVAAMMEGQANALIASVRVPDSSAEEIITIDEDGTVSANGQNIGPIRER